MIGIYKFQNLITQEVYIGQSVNVEERFLKHSREWKNGTTKFYKAIQQYGWDNFSYEIIEECFIEELNDKEKYWISYYNSYNNGYNSTPGGANKYSFNYKEIYRLYDDGFSPKEIANSLSISLTTVYKWLNSYSDWESSTNSILNHIFQYDLEGNYIRDWPSRKEVQRQLGIDAHTISLVIAGKRKSAGNFQWSTKKQDKLPSIIGKTSHPKIIEQYSLNKDYIQSFNSIAEAARHVSGNPSAIRRAAQVGLTRSAYGYRWQYQNADLM